MATRHFTDAELTCKCGCGRLPPQDFQDRIESLRVAFGAPLIISSGARCPEHNERVASTGPNGPHVVAAIDFAISGANAVYKLTKLAFYAGFTGIGVHQSGPRAQRFIHLDDRRAHPGPALWSY